MIHYYKDNGNERIVITLNKNPKNILGSISEYFIEKYRVVYLIIVAILLLGIQAYISLPREEMPEIIFPYGIVTVGYSGAAPQEIERLITDKIETKLEELDAVKEITSTSDNGLSSVVVEFDIGVDIDEKIEEMRSKVSEIENDLPADSLTPIVRGIESGDRPIIHINISGDYDLITLKNIGEDIQKQIERIDGISEVDLVGGLEREINIYVDPSKIATYNVSINEIKNAIANSNINAPGGDIELDKMQFHVRTIAEFHTVEEMEDLIISVKNNTPIYLKDIAKVSDTYATPTSYSERYEKGVSEENTATPTISLSVKRKDNADIIKPSEAIKKLLRDGKGTLYPEDVMISFTGDNAVEVEKTLSDVTGNAISGLLIVIIVLFLFIGLRESLIVAFVIPLSLFSSFFLMQYKGITLNSMSMVALILALGMLVDNAIVIMENIDRIRDEGLDIVHASKVATNQVAPAVFAATLTTMSAFFPMSLTPGIMGEFLKVIPMVVMFAIGASFVISLVITPTLCSRFLSKHKVMNHEKKGKLENFRKIGSVIFVFVLSLYAFADNGVLGLLSWVCAIIFSGAMYMKQFKFSNASHGELKMIKDYTHMMDKILKSRKKRMGIIVLSVAIFVMSLLTIPLGLLKIELFPKTDTTNLTINVATPSGYLLEDMGNVIRKIEDILFEYPEISNFVSHVGNNGGNAVLGGSAGDDPNVGKITIDLVPAEERERSSMEVINSLRKDLKNIAGAEITIEQSTMGPSSGKPISIQLMGEDMDQLTFVANDFEEILKETKGTTEVSTTVGDGPPEIQILIDKERASLLGLDVKNISYEMRNAIQGIKVSTLKENQDEIDIIIRTNDEEMKSINDLEKIYFSSNTGEKIVFSRVASIVETKGYNAIKHEDLKRVVKVESNLVKGTTSNEVKKDFQSKISTYPLPEGIEIAYGGETESIQESFTDMMVNMGVAILLVFIVLAVQFNSLSQPLVILFSVPLATIGALVGLIITRNNFGLFAFMGIVSLVGIAVNDAIVLVDYTNYLRKNGYELMEAIKEAGKTRFLPVFATSITTIGGILPLALKEQDYAQMGFALIFGLMVSTVLTLIIIPILYSLVEELKVKVRKRVPVLADRN